ncbi:MAG: hypothetical protein VKL59_19740 [Nostocaceae cyanobacterium]|nr:hypothetical protein [Nostocaceae cyanobacterium]
MTSVLLAYGTADTTSVANYATATLISAPEHQLLASKETEPTQGDQPPTRRGEPRRLSFHRGSGRQELPDIG